MDDNKAVAQSGEEPVTIPDNSPQSQEVTTSPQTETTTSNTDDLPASEEERRRAFQEQRQKIKELQEQVKTRESSESALRKLKGTPQVQPVDAQQFVNPETGETDWVRYNWAKEQQITAHARQAAADEVDEFRARDKYPEVFSDPEAEKTIAAEWFYERTQGNNVSVTDIAAKVAKRYGQAVKKAEEQGAKKVLEEVGEKERAGMTASSQNGSSARQLAQTQDMESKRMATRLGDQQAIVDRLAGVGWANK